MELVEEPSQNCSGVRQGTRMFHHRGHRGHRDKRKVETPAGLLAGVGDFGN